jgi:hypothetical protein
MKRRLYFLVPEKGYAERLVDELSKNGINRKQIHAIAYEGIELGHLPQSSQWLKQDASEKVERWLWRANLALFFTALIVALVLIAYQLPFWAMLPVAVMLMSFYSGFRFATSIPNAHLAELKAAMKHGEIILLIDVPKSRVYEIESIVSQSHPEVVAGGVGWSMPALQL